MHPPLSARIPLTFDKQALTRIVVPMLYNIELGASSIMAYVEIGRRDQWRSIGSGIGRELSVSSAWLQGVVVHSGLRYAYIHQSWMQT